MDAHAYLVRYGWGGIGQPLNPKNRAGLGLARPILVGRRKNNEGVGKKPNTDSTNQWWLRGFEDALAGIGKDQATPAPTPKSNALTSELYRFFVRGEGLSGTIKDKKEIKTTGDKSAKSKSKSTKRKRGDEDDSERRASKKEKALRREEKATRKAEKAALKEEKLKRRALRAEKKDKKEKRKSEKLEQKSKKSASRKESSTTVSTEQEQEQGSDAMDVDEPLIQTKEKKERKSKRSKKYTQGTEDVDSKKNSKKDKKSKAA